MCSVRYIFKATKQGAFESVLVHYLLLLTVIVYSYIPLRIIVDYNHTWAIEIEKLLGLPGVVGFM